MYLPNEIVNIIFSFVERPKSSKILNEIISGYHSFIQKGTIGNCNSPFHTYYFRLFLPIWKRWPENYPSLKNMKS